jgi:hypothetical protein
LKDEETMNNPNEMSTPTLMQAMDWRLYQILQAIQQLNMNIHEKPEVKINPLQAPVNKLISETKKLQEEVQYQREEIKELQEDRHILIQRLDTLEESSEQVERETKRCNVKFFGIEEYEDYYASCEDQIIDVLNDTSSFKDWTAEDINRAYRLGEKQLGGEPRPLVVQFQRWKDKMDLMSDSEMRNRMRKTGIRFTADLTTRQRSLVDFHRQQGKTAFYRNGRLQVLDRPPSNPNEHSQTQRNFQDRGRYRQGGQPQVHRTHTNWRPQDRKQSHRQDKRDTEDRQYRTNPNPRGEDYSSHNVQEKYNRERRPDLGNIGRGTEDRQKGENNSRQTHDGQHRRPRVVPGHRQYSEVVTDPRKGRQERGHVDQDTEARHHSFNSGEEVKSRRKRWTESDEDERNKEQHSSRQTSRRQRRKETEILDSDEEELLKRKPEAKHQQEEKRREKNQERGGNNKAKDDEAEAIQVVADVHAPADSMDDEPGLVKDMDGDSEAGGHQSGHSRDSLHGDESRHPSRSPSPSLSGDHDGPEPDADSFSENQHEREADPDSFSDDQHRQAAPDSFAGGRGVQEQASNSFSGGAQRDQLGAASNDDQPGQGKSRGDDPHNDSLPCGQQLTGAGRGVTAVQADASSSRSARPRTRATTGQNKASQSSSRSASVRARTAKQRTLSQGKISDSFQAVQQSRSRQNSKGSVGRGRATAASK